MIQTREDIIEFIKISSYIILGIIWGLYIKSIVLFCTFLLVLIIVRKKLKLKKIYIIIFLMMYIYSSFYNYKFENKYKDISIGEFIIIIESNKQEKEYVNKYICRVESFNNNTKYKNTKLILYTDKTKIFEYGDKLKVYGELSLAEESRNYKGFNYRRTLWQNNIYGILNSHKIIKIGNNNSIEKLLNNLKIKLEFNIDSVNIKNEYKSFLKGILLGDTNDISNEIKEKFRDSSLSHILAISGMHITYIIVIINFSLRKINSKKIKRNHFYNNIIFICITNRKSPIKY